MYRKNLVWVVITLLIFSLISVACGSDAAEEPVSADESSNDTPSTTEDTASQGGESDPGGEIIGGDNLLERASNGDFAGSTVSIFGAIVDDGARNFDASMAPFEERTGIDIQYEGSGDFETLIQVRVEGGDPPDIAIHPQPGLLAGLVNQGVVIDPSTFLGDDFLQQQYSQGYLDSAMMGDQLGGLRYSASVKSLVWYPKDDFEAAGYAIPETWDELLALSETILEEQGVPPWCIGIESSGATGWVATDWIEDIMLRTQPTEVYDQWTSGELPFDSPEVRNAIDTMANIWKNEEWVLGGTVGIVTTPFGDSPTQLFDDPPSCWLHRQASFAPVFFPDDAAIGEDVDFFYLPPIDPEYGEPVLTGGDLVAMYSDRPEVRAVMAYLATGESTQAWVEAGGLISPHKDASLDWYTTDVDRRFAEMLQNASVTRFDGSDLMPAPVGAGEFWTGITDWVTGASLDEVLPVIDAAWPKE